MGLWITNETSQKCFYEKILHLWKNEHSQAVKKWHIMCEKRKFHALVISKMLLPLRRKSKMLVAKAFVRWVTVSLTHPTYRWAQAGRELAIKMHHLSMVWKRNKVSQAFRAWTTHTHLIHHLILEKNFIISLLAWPSIGLAFIFIFT